MLEQRLEQEAINFVSEEHSRYKLLYSKSSRKREQKDFIIEIGLTCSERGRAIENRVYDKIVVGGGRSGRIEPLEREHDEEDERDKLGEEEIKFSEEKSMIHF